MFLSSSLTFFLSKDQAMLVPFEANFCFSLGVWGLWALVWILWVLFWIVPFCQSHQFQINHDPQLSFCLVICSALSPFCCSMGLSFSSLLNVKVSGTKPGLLLFWVLHHQLPTRRPHFFFVSVYLMASMKPNLVKLQYPHKLQHLDRMTWCNMSVLWSLHFMVGSSSCFFNLPHISEACGVLSVFVS